MSDLFSEQYHDVYFSALGGLAEKRHVFLGGNNLPHRWQGRPDFVIAEAGFGTGLSFLAAAQMFLQTTPASSRLHFVSFEAYPLKPHQIKDALDPWRCELGPLMDDLVCALPRPIPGIHRVVLWERVFLTLAYGDINDYLPSMELSVDAWFLDGFTPVKNPAMWSDSVFDAVGAASATGATAATYSAARIVKDGLARAGFDVLKKKGFGHKADMTAGIRTLPGKEPLESYRARRICVLGGGLAGAAAAWALRKFGHDPVIVAPRGLADGASGNPRGLYNPRFSKEYNAGAAFYSAAFARFHSFLSAHSPAETGWVQNGALHLERDPDQAARLGAIISTWGWGQEDARRCDTKEASGCAGVDVHAHALWLPHAGSVSPQKLCAFYAKGIEVRPDLPAFYDDLVVANGIAALQVPRLSHLPLHTVRGQVSFVRENENSTRLKTNLCYGGYLAAAENGVHVLGATFQRWLTGLDSRDEDHDHVLKKLSENFDLGLMRGDVVGARAALRVTSRDHLPVVGRVVGAQDTPALYVSLAHGSHGVLSAHLAAWMIAEEISGIPKSMKARVATCIHPDRFG